MRSEKTGKTLVLGIFASLAVYFIFYDFRQRIRAVTGGVECP
jgi:hypothetical protein